MALRLLQRLLLLSCSITAIAAPVPAVERATSNTIVLPSQDSFYQPPTGYESASLGAILAKRQIPVPGAIDSLAPGKTQSVWQVLYRSSDDNGQPLAVVTTIFVPTGGDPNKFFTQSIAYDSSDVDCSPSYTLQSPSTTGPDSIVIALALSSGWYVQSPDFESYKAAFTNGIISGQTMLDSLRAAKQSGSFTGLSANPRIGMNGGSGGALAIEWALELQPTYAKDITISGATLGSLTPNIANVMHTVNKGPAAGLIPSAITGLAQASPQLQTYLNTNLISSTAANFESANTRCINQNQDYYNGKDITAYFKNPNFLDDQVVHDLVQKVGIMGTHGTPSGPVYVYKGANDEVSPVADTDTLVDEFCNAGASVTYVRNALTEHVTESVLGIPGAYAWLDDRLNGVPAQQGCNKVFEANTTFSLNDLSKLGSLATALMAALQSVLNS
ncbi:hypothetical protein AMS68_005617 [Peltaster fructicola]|uniref:Uncharacterized protein n=1 Tax=Peltaster fructicola TaxID=286661 RepID=A0A6H0Y0C5_9PEZI|nr:hypothetical protein AMS68_005617 [Peltaster fructicola]